MMTLRFLVRVSPEKRQELVQSLSSFIPEKSARPRRRPLSYTGCVVIIWRNRLSAVIAAGATGVTLSDVVDYLALLVKLEVAALQQHGLDQGATTLHP